MKLTTTGRIQAATFPVHVWFDERHADVLTFRFVTRPRGADWDIGRDLLSAGLMERTGEMDVHVWPYPDTDEVAIKLCPPGKSTTIRLPWDPIAEFVRRAYEHVPRGDEYKGLDWGQLLATTGGAA